MKENLKLHVQELFKRHKIENSNLEKELIRDLEEKYDEILAKTDNEVTSFNKVISLIEVQEDGNITIKEEKKELSKEEKKKIRRFSKYNLIITTFIFLAISLIFNSWLTSWIIFLLSSFVEFIYRLFINRNNFKKKLYYSLSTIFVVLSIFSLFIVSLGIYLASYESSFELNSEYLRKEVKISATSLPEFEINLITSDLVVESYEGSEIIIEQYAQNKLPNKYLFSLENNEKLLLQEKKAPVFFLTNYYHSIIKVSLPSSLKIDILNLYGISSDFNVSTSSSISNLEIESTSGNIKVFDSINITNSKLKVLNGEVELTNSKFKKIELDSTSGSLNVLKVFSEELNVNSISGRVDLNNIESYELNINSNKCRINIVKISAKLNLNDKNGNITIVDPYFSDHSFINSEKGNIDFQFNSNNDYNFVLESKSGTIYNEYNSNLYGFVVSVTSNSGNINILILND